ncbi:hypothetical protein P879_00785, partial [Paragonimus westermani]
QSLDSEAGFLIQPNNLSLIRPSFFGKNDSVSVAWYENGTLANLSHRAFGSHSESLHDFDPCTVYDSVITARTVEKSALLFQANFKDARKPRTPKLTITDDHTLLIDWTSDFICKPVEYAVHLDEHSKSVRTLITPGHVTQTGFPNVLGCNAVDICISAVYSPLVNETTCVLGWRPKKDKPSNVKFTKAGDTVNISWILQDSCQPDSYQVYIRKGSQSVSFHVVPGSSNQLSILSPPECPPCIVLVGAAYPELYNTLSDPVRWPANSGEYPHFVIDGFHQAWFGVESNKKPPSNRRLVFKGPNRIYRKTDTVEQHTLTSIGYLRCAVLYYRVTIRNERDNNQTYFLLGREECLPLITNEEASYTANVKTVTTEGQTFGSDVVRLQIAEDGMFKVERVCLHVAGAKAIRKNPEIFF